MEPSKHIQMKSLRDGPKRERERERDVIVSFKKINERARCKAGKDREMLVREKKRAIYTKHERVDTEGLKLCVTSDFK